ncbi:MAG: NTP transferase domain-containing protein [Fidelibacterota bacterium]|nr:MAG: NTP transferase domain-containing protein [Candidatus Neomarinimicrobiota bacterium]
MMPDPKLAAIILAGGRGKRMNSDHPKVLHVVGGRPMIHWVIDTAKSVGADPLVVVVGRGRRHVKESLKDTGVMFATQHKPLGTAHAVEQTRSILASYKGCILVLSGDVPGISPGTIKGLCRRHGQTKARATMLTAEVDKPTGYGRVLRDSEGHLLRVVEEKDATDEERTIREINGGIYVFDSQALFDTLPLVQNNNKQNEFYLPDILYILREQNQIVAIEKASNYKEILGVNTKEELRKVHAEVFE